MDTNFYLFEYPICFMCDETAIVGLFLSFYSSWFDPGLDLIKVPTKPSKTIDPLGKPEGNIVHRMYCRVSLEIALRVTRKIKCL